MNKTQSLQQIKKENELLKAELAEIKEKLQISVSDEQEDTINDLAEAQKVQADEREVMVTIVMNTFNQEDFIAQALDSIFMQEVNFRYNVIIGDDHSTDRTAEIIMDYYHRYPDLIIPIIREENIGGVMNSYDTLTRADGKYIAILEGEDYWTDVHKLQKQVDFLEENPEYSGCTHKVSIVDHTGKMIDPNPKWLFQGTVYSWNEFLSWTLPSNAQSWVYRNIYKRDDIDSTVLYRASDSVSDTTQLLLLLQFGNIYNFGKVMAHYRRDFRPTKPSWSALPLFEKQIRIYDVLRFYERYSLEVFHRPIEFTNTEQLLTSLFTMCCDNPSRFKLNKVKEILDGLKGEEKNKYETLYKVIKFKTPFRKTKRKREAKKHAKNVRKQQMPKYAVPQLLREVRSLKSTQQQIIDQLNQIMKGIEEQ